jgi:hypothetical protein
MQAITENPALEARLWLRSNPNPSALATNRFGATQNALAFVDRLYAAGAAEVLVDDPFVDGDGFPYADTLVVRVSRTADAWWLVEKLCTEEGPGDVPPGDFTMNTPDVDIRLWWD